MCLEKGKTVMKAFVTSQFEYCFLVRVFHRRVLNNKINSLHERALKITYGDRSCSFRDRLKKRNSVSVHHRNIQALVTEMFKVENNILSGMALNRCPMKSLPNELKESESLNAFKFTIKRSEECPCRICKIYLGQMGFI